jgi:hypothetical protein
MVVDRLVRVTGCFLRPELDRQLVHSQVDPDDMVVDEITVIAFCTIREMRAHGGCDACLEFGCRHPGNGSGTLRLTLEERR